MSETLSRRGRPPTFDRDAALDAAMTLFWRHGYDGASMAMLTKATGVSPPTLYAAFGPKEELYRQALDHYLRQEGRARARLLKDEPSAQRAVAAYLRDAAACYARPEKPRGCMVAAASPQSCVNSQAARDAVAALRVIAFTTFIRKFEEAKAGGELAPDIDTRALARFYAAVLQGMSAQAIDGATAGMLQGIVDFALAAWPAGVRSETAA
jgi:AcrR family transcriptional regulator